MLHATALASPTESLTLTTLYGLGQDHWAHEPDANHLQVTNLHTDEAQRISRVDLIPIIAGDRFVVIRDVGIIIGGPT